MPAGNRRGGSGALAGLIIMNTTINKTIAEITQQAAGLPADLQIWDITVRVANLRPDQPPESPGVQTTSQKGGLLPGSPEDKIGHAGWAASKPTP